MFVLIAQDMRNVTVQLQKLLVPTDKKTILKTIFICFVVFLILSQDNLYKMLAVQDRVAPVEPRPIKPQDVAKGVQS